MGDSTRQDDPVPPRVSVILLTYNHERFVAKAIESVLGQRIREPVELIVSEDASTDRTLSIVRRYRDAHPDRIRVIASAQNLNTNIVWTRAFEAARGEFLAFLDGDDYWASETKLQRQVAILEADANAAMCFHNARIVNAEGEDLGELHVPSADEVPRTFLDLLWRNPIPGSSPLIRRSAIADIPDWFPHAPFADWVVYLLATRHGHVTYIDEPLSIYRKHEGGAWNGLSRPQQYRGLLDFYAFLEEVLPESLAPRILENRRRWSEVEWYVAHVGGSFDALYEAGLRRPDGRCAGPVALLLTARVAAAGIRVRGRIASGADRTTPFAIVARLDGETRRRDDLGRGDSFAIEFVCNIAVGDSFSLMVEIEHQHELHDSMGKQDLFFYLDAIDAR